MFDSLSSRIQNAFTALRGEVRLTESQVEDVLREIRLALLEADVNFNVVKAFIDRVRDRAMDQDVLRSLSPAQQVVKIVRDELLALFAGTEGGLTKDAPKPRVVLLLGLQGAGKTTTSGKLGRWLKRQGRNPVMVSTDVRRPAAIQQLEIVGDQAGVKVYAPATMDPVARASGALAEARAKGHDTVIVDTAGRLHIDDELMAELELLKSIAHPSELLYVADSRIARGCVSASGWWTCRLFCWPSVRSCSRAAGRYTSVETSSGWWPPCTSQRASLAVLVVLPEPCRPVISTTAGRREDACSRA